MISPYKNSSGFKRFLVALVLGLVVVTTPTMALLAPRPAQAQFTDAANLAVNTGKWIWEKVKDAATWVYEHGAATAFRNMARTFTQKIAYDSANMLASGGKGQTPLFTWKNLGKSISDAADDATGSFLDGIASGGVWGKFNICEPTGPNAPFAKLMITLPAFYEQKPIQPRCTLSKFKENWNKVLTDPESKKNFLKDFAVVLDPKQNELGVGLNVQSNLAKDVELKKYLEEHKVADSGGILPVTQTITNFIKTPAPRVGAAVNMTTEQALKEPLVFTGDILADALGTFTNTLAAKLMKRLMEGDIPNPAGIGPSSLFGSAYGASGVEYAQAINATLLTPPLAGGDVLDVISQFSGCPDDTQYAAINNCTIDSKFEQTLRKADEGKALTVGEAINKGALNGSWVFKQEKPHNVRLPDAWYLSDIKKLRLARILPLGWELAAQKVSGQDISLNDVIKGFADTTSSYYHLIDPNWVLKAPPSQCRMRGPGQLLQQEGARRQDTCVDVQQCVAENEDGTCASWGYCTKEKNIWRLGGDSCEFPTASGSAPYASCQTFTAASGDQVSYLQNSLANYDDGGCSGAAGCKWYSSLFNGSATNVAASRYGLNNYCSNDVKKACTNDSDCSTGGRCLNPRLYLKGLDKITCDAKNEGCTQFLRLSNVNASLLPIPGVGSDIFNELIKKVTAPGSIDTYDKYAQTQSVTLRSAASYLNCYDSNPKNDSPECKNYLTMCKPEEVGCDLYTPKDGSPSIPGTFETNNTCSAECVGYQTYQQQPSFFEKNPPPEQSFIPQTAKKCSAQAVGCEEFTNVSQNEQREYYSQLKQCIKPGPEAATYFTWIGSDLTGYQLKKYSLKSASGGAPVTVDNTADCRAGSPGSSLQFPTNYPDCKEFYDVTGAVYYRNFSATITASDNCNKYRATKVAQSDCGLTGGSWEGGSCFYNAIPGEGKKCSLQYVGCREFKGPTGDNVKLVFPLSTFGDSDVKTNWSVDASPASGWRSGTSSNDSSVAFGHSFDSGLDKIIYKDVTDNSITAGQQYVISFWAKKSSLPIAAAKFNGLAVAPLKVESWGVKNWWQDIKKQWSQVPTVSAQVSPVSLDTSTNNPFDNTGFAPSQDIKLDWSVKISDTDQVKYNLARVSPNPQAIISDTVRLANNRCQKTANGFADDKPCDINNPVVCKDSQNICQPADYKCDSGLYKGVTCTAGNDSTCKNLTDTCKVATGKCNLATTQACAVDADCRAPDAVCKYTTTKCTGGRDNHKAGQLCDINKNNNDCQDIGICNSFSSASSVSGSLNVALPVYNYPDKGNLPVSSTYKLSASYLGTNGQYNTPTVADLAYTVKNPPGSFNILTPNNGATNQSVTPTITWSTSPRAINYVVSLAPGNTSYNLAATNICGGNSCSFTVPTNASLQNSTLYTVSLQAVNESSIKPINQISFTTVAASAGDFSFSQPADDLGTPLPEDERLSIPVSDLSHDPIDVNIAWSPSFGATSYIVTVYQSAGAGMSLKWNKTTTPSQTAAVVPAGTLKYDTDCRIEVTALSGAASKSIKLEGGSGDSPCHTQQPPAKATLSSPKDAAGGTAVIKTVNPEFRWSRGMWNKTFDLVIQEDKGAGYKDFCQKKDLTNQYIITPDLGCEFKDGGTYRWRVVSRNGHPNVAVTDWSNFRIDMYVNQYGGGGVGYADLPKIVGSNKNIPVPAAATKIEAPGGAVGSAGTWGICPNPTFSGRGPFSVTVNWEYPVITPPPTDPAVGFTLYRGIGGRAVQYLGCFGDGSVCGTKQLGGLAARSFKDESPELVTSNSTRLVYQLRAFNAGGESKGVSTVVTTTNLPAKPSCISTVVNPSQGDIVIKLMVDGQPAAGGISYEINGSGTGNNIPDSGLKLSNQAPGDYSFKLLSGNVTGFTGAEIYSVEANPGGSVNCVGACDEVKGILQAGQTLIYTINFVGTVAAPTVTPKANLDFNINETGQALTNDWQLYTIGLKELPIGADASQGVRVSIFGNTRFVIDNIALQQVTDTVYVNKGTWVMPKDAQGQALCRVQDAGCKAYTDKQNATYNLTGFSKICRAEAVGCEALIDTRNSNSPREAVTTVNDQTIYTPADQLVYRVYDIKKACATTEQACQRVGEPNLGTIGQVGSWGDRFVRLDPDSYSTSASPLCSAQQNQCAAYKIGSTIHNFKDPGNNVCEYKQLTPAQQYGWYKQGTSEPCNLLSNASFENYTPGPSVCRGGNNSGAACKADGDCAGGGVCDKPADFNYWDRNGSNPSSPGVKAQSRLYAVPSFGQGFYLGNNVLEIISAAQAYSGVWSQVVELPKIANTPRYFTISAHLYVPVGSKMDTPWILSQHAYDGNDPTPANCPVRAITGQSSCHHYEYEPGANYVVTEADKGKWVYKSATIKVDPGTKYLSVGIVEGTGWANNQPDPTTFKADQVIYVDGISLSEGAAPYAYACPAEMSSCKAYRDPALTNKVYYYLDNNKLDRTSCSGQASEKEGCLLLNDMSQAGELPWNAEATYERSRSQDDTSVTPESGRGRCSNSPTRLCAKSSDCGASEAYCDYTLGNNSLAPDTNLLLKVRRDRICAEWLSCQTSTTVTDPQTGKTREICYSLGRCDQASGSKAAGQCANWVEPEPQQHPLDEADYVGRNVTWSGNDYSGYSIPGLCSLDMISSTPACGFSIAKAKACRVYPEGDSPFPSSVARFDSENADTAKVVNKSEGYKDANVCQPGEDCECVYQRATYKNGETRFVGYKSTPPDPVNKVPEGTNCVTPSDEKMIEACNEQSKLKQISLARGLRGYCLETDASRRINAGKSEACMTWLPIDVIQGEISIFDDQPNAGFTSDRTDQNLLYCLQANSNINRGTTGTDKYFVKSKQKGRTVTLLEQQSPGSGRNGLGYGVTDTPGTRWNDVVEWPGKKVGIFTSDTSDNNLHGRVDHILTFSVSLSDFERQMGGLDAIDSVHIEYYFGNDRAFKSGYSDQNNRSDAIDLSRLVLSRKEGIASCWKGRGNGYDDCALEVSFNPTDENKFLTFTLTDTHAGDSTFTIGIHLYSREWCYRLAQVVDKQENITNKAQTNRVNVKSTYPISGLGYKYNADAQGNLITTPFGAALDSPLKQMDKIVYVHQTPSKLATRFPAKNDSDFHDSASAIYNCRTDRSGFTCGNWMCQVNGPERADGRIDPDKLGKACTVTVGASSYCGVTPACPSGQTCDNGYKKDQPYMCTGTNPAIIIPGSDGVAVTPQNMVKPLKEIFTKLYKTYTWAWDTLTSSYKYILDDSSPYLYGILGNDPAKDDPSAVAPILRAVTRDDKGRVLGEDSNVNHRFSVSTVQQSKTEGEVVGVSPVVVTVAFYAYNPNGNQMPLRFVGVDWDNSLQTDKNIQVSASLRNHKAYCQPEKVCAGDKALSCSSDNQCGDKKPCQLNDKYNFGDSQDACISDDSERAGYFYYSNVYTCKGPSSPNWSNNALGLGQGACVYTPQVAVRDNWGWWSNGVYDDQDELISGTGWQTKAVASSKDNSLKIIVKPKDK